MPTRFRRSAFFRFAVLLPLLVSGLAALLFVPIYREAVQHIRAEVIAAIDRESWDLEVEFHEGGVEGLIAAIDKRGERELDPRAVYLLLDAQGRILAGNWHGWPDAVPRDKRQWVAFQASDGEAVEGQVLPIFGARTLLVARRSPLVRFDEHLAVQLAWAALAVFAVSALAAMWFTSRLRRRLRGLAQGAEDIRRGDLGRRLSLTRRGDEIDALADRFNRTFADLERLVDGVRQVSNHLAHDLRRPLQLARQHLEVLSHSALEPQARAAIDASLIEVDDLLGTFAALLRLARLQAGGFELSEEVVDLARVVSDAGELFAPVAAESGRQVHLLVQACQLRGDRHLLFQALQNLIENALSHGAGDIDIELRANGILEVRDYGEGVPDEALSRLSERFYRVDQARTAPGIGIGLALTAAIAELHHGELRFANAKPGLRAQIRFSRLA